MWHRWLLEIWQKLPSMLVVHKSHGYVDVGGILLRDSFRAITRKER